MSLQSIIFKPAIALSIALVTFLGFLMSSQIAHAATVSFWVSDAENGLPVSSVSRGQEVWFMWQITGTVTGCFIDNGVGPVSFNTGSNSLKYTSTLSGNVTFKITCDGITAGAPPINTAEPIVTMDIQQGQNLQISSTRGYVTRVDVTWESQNADECELVWREKESAPGVKIHETSSSDYWYPKYLSGSIRYDGSPRSISETTTFFITCINNNTDAETTGSVKLTVEAPEPPEELTLDMWTSTPTVFQDELYGWATAKVGFDSDNATWCEQSAYYEDGTKYDPNPSGWDFSGKRDYESDNILLAETTIFEVTCGRDAITIGGINYPASSPVTEKRTVVVKPPPTVPVGDWDRTSLPSVNATITADPNPAPKNPISELALPSITVQSENADYCILNAYEFMGASHVEKEYDLEGWSDRKISGNTNWTTSVALEKKIRLEVDCRRDYDLQYGNAAEKANGQKIDSVVVEISDTYTTPDAPIAYVYGNAVAMSASNVWNAATERIGWNAIKNNNSLYYLESPLTNGISSISFPFRHPLGASDQYDIHFRYCDEKDGVSTFSFYVNGVQVGGDLVTDRPDSPDYSCRWNTLYTDKIVGGITISHGDNITIKCSTPDSGERCRFSNIYFGAGGNGGSVQVGVSPAEVSLLWLSKNASRCDSFVATDSAISPWHTGTQNSGRKTVNVSQDTTFSVACGLNTGIKDESEVRVTVGSTDEVVDSYGLEYGDCWNEVGAWIDSPPGYWPDPTPGDTAGKCIPLVDLEAEASSVDISSAIKNAIAGTYNNVLLRMGIKNLGPGELVASETYDVTYKANAILDTSNGKYIESVFGLSNVDSLVENFTESIDAPSVVPPVETFVLVGPLEPSPRLNGVPFGTHVFCARVNIDDYDGSPNQPEWNEDLTRNTDCGSRFIEVPEPPMSITADKKIIRKGEAVTVSWSAETSYPLECIVRGAGGVTDEFWANKFYPHPAKPYTGDKKLISLTSTSEFILQCTEPHTGTVFDKKIRVEVIPDSQEI